MTPRAFEIRDAAFVALSGYGLFKTVKNSLVQQMEPADELPAATVFVTREVRAADGDANAGEPHFIHDLTLGLIITIDSGDQSRLEDVLAYYTDQTVNRLLSDTTFLTHFEGISGITESQAFPKDGETYYAEARVEMTVQFRSRWAPYVPDDYLRTRMTTRPIANPDAPAITTIIDQAQP